MTIKKNEIQLKKQSVFFFMFFTICFLLLSYSYAEVLERVVAIVNDDVILLSEFEEKMMSARKSDEGVSEDVVLDKMIDGLLILEQAKKIKSGDFAAYSGIHDKEAIITGYLQRRIRVLIHIPFDVIDSYYLKNRERFGNSDLSEVRDEIEAFLLEQEFEVKIREHYDELRKRAYIRKQLKLNH